MDKVKVIYGPQVTDEQKLQIAHKLMLNFLNPIEDGSPDFYLVAGGDGTFLLNYHHLNETQVPIFGVNLGHLGFFMESTMENLSNDLKAIKEDRYKIENYHMVEANVTCGDNVKLFHCVNDFVIKGCGPDGEVAFSATKFDVYIDDVFVETAFGDGFIVSAPAGSTAYNRSARGAMVHPHVRAYQLTELPNVNSSSWRSFDRSIIMDNQALKIIPHGNCILGSDGRRLVLNPSEIFFKISYKTVNFIRTEGFNFFNPLQRSFLNP